MKTPSSQTNSKLYLMKSRMVLNWSEIERQIIVKNLKLLFYLDDVELIVEESEDDEEVENDEVW